MENRHDRIRTVTRGVITTEEEEGERTTNNGKYWFKDLQLYGNHEQLVHQKIRK